MKKYAKLCGNGIVLAGVVLAYFLAKTMGASVSVDESGVQTITRSILQTAGIFTAVVLLIAALRLVIVRLMSGKNSKNEDDRLTSLDRMRFTKNTASANLDLLAIVFDVFYFVTVYRINNAWCYKALIGGSIIYNLVFMLSAFLGEENIKNRKCSFDWLVVALGVLQFARIAVYPMMSAEQGVVSDPQLLAMIAYLCLSGICCIWSGITSRIENNKLRAYLQSATADNVKGVA